MNAEGHRELKRLGMTIRRHRERLHGKVSQEDFAEMCDLHRTYIGQVERGEKNISFVNILRIAKAFKTKPSELFASGGL
jgi:transcriptional regulator with XRE-family HTH domain